MSILKNIFGKKPSENKQTNESNINWIRLTSLAQLAEIEELSKTTVVGVFKHSTRCSISRSVLSKFEGSFNKELPLKMYYLDILNYREISNEIGYKFQVIHQSPQLLLIQNKETIFHASHYDIISQIDLQQFMK